MTKEYILCAANWYNDQVEHIHNPINVPLGFVTCGRRHHNCISTFAQIVGFPYDKQSQKLHDTEQQGFLTSTNRFVDRIEAYVIALNAGQLDGRYIHDEGRLFSEDLY